MYSSSPDGQPPKFCTVFNHLVKSGGTSIKQQLFQSSEAEGDAVPGTENETNTREVANGHEKRQGREYRAAIRMFAKRDP